MIRHLFLLLTLATSALALDKSNTNPLRPRPAGDKEPLPQKSKFLAINKRRGQPTTQEGCETMKLQEVGWRTKLMQFVLIGVLAMTGVCGAQMQDSFGGEDTKLSEWKGFVRSDFQLDGRKCIVVSPKSAAPGKPWIWRAYFFGHEPQTDIALLEKGFHLAYMDVVDMYGCPEAVAHWNVFYKYLTGANGFSKRVALEGMSRGGLIVYNWAKANPEKVACIYADAPVCDIRSWPGGKGVSRGDTNCWEICKKAYGLTEETAADFQGNPLDGLEALAQAHVPLLHVCGADDDVVPMAENTDLLQQRYEQLGGSIQVISKPGVGHHPHSLKDPAVIVDFILKNTIGGERLIRTVNGLDNRESARQNSRR